MKLEVGQYIRTYEGQIAKIIDLKENPVGIKDTYYILDKEIIDRDCMVYDKKVNSIDITFDEDIEQIKKVRYNIMDLIKAGDIIVNCSNEKLEVLLIDDELMVRNTGLIYDNNYYLPIKSITIKSVITHEQMEQMAYKVGE